MRLVPWIVSAVGWTLYQCPGPPVHGADLLVIATLTILTAIPILETFFPEAARRTAGRPNTPALKNQEGAPDQCQDHTARP